MTFFKINLLIDSLFNTMHRFHNFSYCTDSFISGQFATKTWMNLINTTVSLAISINTSISHEIFEDV